MSSNFLEHLLAVERSLVDHTLTGTSNTSGASRASLLQQQQPQQQRPSASRDRGPASLLPAPSPFSPPRQQPQQHIDSLAFQPPDSVLLPYSNSAYSSHFFPFPQQQQRPLPHRHHTAPHNLCYSSEDSSSAARWWKSVPTKRALEFSIKNHQHNNNKPLVAPVKSPSPKRSAQSSAPRSWWDSNVAAATCNTTAATPPQQQQQQQARMEMQRDSSDIGAGAKKTAADAVVDEPLMQMQEVRPAPIRCEAATSPIQLLLESPLRRGENYNNNSSGSGVAAAVPSAASTLSAQMIAVTPKGGHSSNKRAAVAGVPLAASSPAAAMMELSPQTPVVSPVRIHGRGAAVISVTSPLFAARAESGSGEDGGAARLQQHVVIESTAKCTLISASVTRAGNLKSSSSSSKNSVGEESRRDRGDAANEMDSSHPQACIIVEDASICEETAQQQQQQQQQHTSMYDEDVQQPIATAATPRSLPVRIPPPPKRKPSPKRSAAPQQVEQTVMVASRVSMSTVPSATASSNTSSRFGTPRDEVTPTGAISPSASSGGGNRRFGIPAVPAAATLTRPRKASDEKNAGAALEPAIPQQHKVIMQSMRFSMQNKNPSLSAAAATMIPSISSSANSINNAMMNKFVGVTQSAPTAAAAAAAAVVSSLVWPAVAGGTAAADSFYDVPPPPPPPLQPAVTSSRPSLRQMLVALRSNQARQSAAAPAKQQQQQQQAVVVGIPPRTTVIPKAPSMQSSATPSAIFIPPPLVHGLEGNFYS